jgi:hypothetical protein
MGKIGFSFAVGLLIAGLAMGAKGQVADGAATTTVERRPITEQQLRRYLEESMLLGASQQHILEEMEGTRKTLPPWFPDAVWQDVKHNVAAVDLVKVVLPAYQKYFTERDGAAIVLMFEGPTGHEYAEAALQSRLAAVHSGLEGSAADRAAMGSDAEVHVQELAKKRAAELTPEERAEVRALGASGHSSGADSLKLDDEQNVLIQKKMNEVLHATLAAHNAELEAAQRVYQMKHQEK